MKTIRMRKPGGAARRPLFLAAACLFAAAPLLAFAQDGEPPEKKPETPPKAGGPGEGEEAPAGPDEIAEVLRQIEKHMSEAERLLTGFDAGSEAGAEQQAAADLLKKLLDDAGKQQSSALSQIDKLLELAAKQAQQQQQRGGGQSQRQRSERERQREAEAERERLSRKDKPEDGKQSESEPKGEEKDGRRKPPNAGAEQANHADVTGRWGNLPPALRARIHQGNWSDFPPEYREKLEKWYKRISAEEK